MLEYLFVLLYYCKTVFMEINVYMFTCHAKNVFSNMHLTQFTPSIVAAPATLAGHCPGNCSPCPGQHGTAPRLRTGTMQAQESCQEQSLK